MSKSLAIAAARGRAAGGSGGGRGGDVTAISTQPPARGRHQRTKAVDREAILLAAREIFPK